MMSKIKHGLSYLFHNHNQLFDSIVLNCFKWLPDKTYLSLRFRFRMGYWMDFNSPKTFNEKLQWIKLYDRKPEYTSMVDKILVKDYVATLIGKEFVIPTIGVWDKPEDIDWENLPQKFVLKTNHGGGNTGVVICKDKAKLDRKMAVVKLNKSLKTSIYNTMREWPYKNINRKVFAEQYMIDTKAGELKDYKFFCFDGKVKAMFIASERQIRKEPFFDFFDENFQHLKIKQGHPNSEVLPEKPACFEKMKELASILSKGIPHVRVDFYEVDGRVYFGELTFFHFGGIVPFVPNEWDRFFGDMIILPKQISNQAL